MFCPVCRSDYPADWKVCPKDATNLLATPQVGKYTIEGLLGVGGMGAVYRAINPDTKARVAIKLMHPSVANADSARQRFQREAASVAALRTSHVVKVYDFGTEDDGTLYLVMELLDGHPLRDEITPGPDYMDLARVQMVMDGALKGLAAAHKAGIVHRDLKPENVFVADTDDGEVPKLLDFGIARVRTKDSDLTRTGSLMGTAAYMAVEQVASGSGEMGPWSDVYAMGAILYEMLAGVPAFGGSTLTDVLQKVLRGDHVPLATVRPGLPPALYQLVERSMSIDAAQRPQDAEQMRSALAAVKIVAPGTPVPPPMKTKGPATSQVGLLATENPTPSSQARPPEKVVSPHAATAPSTPPGVRDSLPLPPAKRSNLPLVIGGVLALGLGGFVAYKVLANRPTPTPPEIAKVAEVHDAAPIDVAIAVDAPAIDAAAAPIEVVRIPPGSYEIGEAKPGHADGLTHRKVVIANELAIDRMEATDADGLPRRNVTWQQAADACAAAGKRLPSEGEWEIAASIAPPDPATATLLRGTAALVPSPQTECTATSPCDMLGSVLEWTADDWGKNRMKVVRGASYRVSPNAGWLATIHARTGVAPATADDELGFRCIEGEPAAKERKVVIGLPPKCDGKAQMKAARDANTAGEYAKAIAAARKGLMCADGPKPQLSAAIVFAACNLGNGSVARTFFPHVPDRRERQLVKQCAAKGVQLP